MVIDVFETDAALRPIGEMFFFVPQAPRPDTLALMPVSVAELNDPAFFPREPFAVFAEAFDAAAKDYGRWLQQTSGCLVIDEAVANDRIAGRFRAEGTWVPVAGSPLGVGSVTGAFNAPLVAFLSPTDALRDTMHAVLSGGRAETIATGQLDAFQVLHPAQTRLLIAGTMPADTTRELWLSLTGVPQAGDSIVLDSVSVDDGIAGRSATPFGMVRLTRPTLGAPELREVWTSTRGWVKLDRVLQTGPLALCGAAWGRFAFDARGEALGAGGARTPLGTLTVSGASFVTRFTVLAPSDTAGDPARPPSAAAFRPMAPDAGDAPRC